MSAKIKTIKKFSYEAIFNFGEISKGDRIDEFPGDNTYEHYNEIGKLLEEGYFNRTSSFKCPDLSLNCIENENGQTIYEYHYNSFDPFASSPESVVVNSYNNNGKLVEMCKYIISSKTTNKEWFTAVDKNGTLSSNGLSLLNAIQTEKLIRKYDFKERVIDEFEYTGDGNLVNRSQTIFYDIEKKKEYIEYNSENKIDERYLALYDNDGYKVEEIMYLKDSKQGFKTKFILDEEKRIVKEIQYDLEGKEVNVENAKHDEFGTTQEVNYHNNEGELDHKMIMKYNVNYNLLEEGVYNPDGRIISKASNIYDEKERLIESSWTVFDKEFVYTSNKYDFDKFNNWIRCIKFDKEIPFKIIEREIEYYE